MDEQEIKIVYNELNRFIEILDNCKNCYYNPETMEYEFDGFIVKESFLYDTCSKFSHYINIINNTLLNKKKNIKSITIPEDDVNLNKILRLYKDNKKGDEDA